MDKHLERLTEHDQSDECPACRARELARTILLPAVAAWEETAELPRHAVALHGAAELLGSLLEAGAGRDDVAAALDRLLDEIEEELAENRALGGPPQGSA